MKKYLLGLALALTAAGSMAVDGYKNVKFGSSYQTVKASKICSLKETSSRNAFSFYSCSDLLFNNEKTTATFEFINGEFLRVLIHTNLYPEVLVNALTEKYGEPVSPDNSNAKELLAKGDVVYLYFDNKTVILGIQLVDGKPKTFLMYQSPSYTTKSNNTKGTGLKDDI
ncbi:hypothetical protein [Morganella morganii]|uniref:hypothetical protein n=1 Tax=Morganella morganii TaxID=582 RepID=UPI00339BA905